MQSRRALRRTAHQQKQDAITVAGVSVAGVSNVTRAQADNPAIRRTVCPSACSSRDHNWLRRSTTTLGNAFQAAAILRYSCLHRK